MLLYILFINSVLKKESTLNFISFPSFLISLSSSTITSLNLETLEDILQSSFSSKLVSDVLAQTSYAATQ
ncbi:hypothetical protein C5472_09680 [Photorhabdus sp. RW14-46]|nr:hypothetical protein [Photorhabdus sp. RW14-46]